MQEEPTSSNHTTGNRCPPPEKPSAAPSQLNPCSGTWPMTPAKGTLRRFRLSCKPANPQRTLFDLDLSRGVQRQWRANATLRFHRKPHVPRSIIAKKQIRQHTDVMYITSIKTLPCLSNHSPLFLLGQRRQQENPDRASLEPIKGPSKDDPKTPATPYQSPRSLDLSVTLQKSG